jgi:adenylate cyclase
MAEERVKRRLAAILAADVVGYSRMMGRDEAGTLARLKSLRTEFLHPKVGEYGGRIVKTTGDGTLIEFGSAVDAVSHAVDVQRGMAERNVSLPEEEQIWLRLGINVGDIIIDGDDIYGDGVNVAARLEALAEPGGICISDRVHDYVGERLDITCEDLGPQAVKNIADPVHVYRIRLGDTAARSTSEVRGPLPLPSKPSIAVLPFENMSDDPEQEFFADGIAEDIITALSKYRWFFVVARNSSFTYKGHPVDVKQVARELGVRYLVEGSVRRSGNRLRITAQLIDAPSGNHIWAERYDRQLDDIFELQDEITETIVSTIEPELGGVERERAKRKPPESLDGWELHQRGLWHLWKKSPADADQAERIFLDVIDRAPGFAAAHAALSYLLFDRVALGWTNADEDTLGRALSEGQTAVSLDDKDPFAHFALGRAHTLQGHFEQAIAELRKALDLNPNFAMAYYGLGHALAWAGRAGEALTPLYKAMRQSPRDPLVFAFENMAGFAHLLLGEYDEAIEMLQSAAGHPNGVFWSNAQLAMAFYELDHLPEAHASLEAARGMQADLSLGTVMTMLRPVNAEFRERMVAALRQLGLPE